MTETMTSGVGELIARLEKATGRDRCLDYELARVANCPMSTDLADWPPHYTESIDAALTLVPEGAVWMVQVDYELPGRAHINYAIPIKDARVRPAENFDGDGATPAIALCVAALRASQEPS